MNSRTRYKSRAKDNSFIRLFPLTRGRYSLTGFTITELLVAIGLLAAVLAVASMIFSHSIDAQRTAMATSEVMRTLQAITDQLNNHLGELQKDGYLVLWSSSDVNDALYFFSTGDFKSWCDPNGKVNSNIARVYFGPSGSCPNDLALDFVLLTPCYSDTDCCDVNFAACQADICANFEDPNDVIEPNRPSTNIVADSSNVRRLLAQNLGSMKIEWTDGSTTSSDQIDWYGRNKSAPGGPLFQTIGPPYIACWSPYNPDDWPRALRFEFTLYDSKGILKGGRRFEHIVYIGN